MIKDVQSLSLLDILPDNLLADEKVAAAAKALDAELQAVTAATVETLHLPRLDVLPEKVLDLLAWQWHVDFYEPLGMSSETKRKLIRKSIAWHRMKGTPAAVEEVAASAFDNTYVKEWFEYGGQPYHFKITTEEIPSDKSSLNRFKQSVETVKNVRSWLDAIEFLLRLEDHEKLSEDTFAGIKTHSIDRYPWRGRYFDGSWNFQTVHPFDGRFLFDGKNIFDGAQGYTETGKTVGHFFDGANAFDGSWKFGNVQDGVIYFNSEEPDAPLIITPKLVLSDNYEIPYTFDGTLAMDGGWTFGRNPMRDVLSITTHHVPKLTMQDIYPLARMQIFDGSWMFGADLRMFDGAWNFNTGLFNGLAEVPGIECRSRLFDGSWQFDGKAAFTQPARPGVLFNAGEDCQENLVIEETSESLDDAAEMQEDDALASRLALVDHLNEHKQFDGSWNFAASQSFSGQNFDGSFRFDNKKHFDGGGNVFDGSWQFNAGANNFAGEEIQEELSVTEIHAELEDTETMEEETPLLIDTGLFFNGAWTFDGDTKIRLDGAWTFDGRYTFTNYPSLDTVFSGARKFDGSWNIKRGGHSFEHSYARTA